MMPPDYRKPGDTGAQIKDPRREPDSDAPRVPPPPHRATIPGIPVPPELRTARLVASTQPESDPPAARVGKRWGPLAMMLIGIVGGASGFVTLGMSMAKRDDGLPTLREMNARFDTVELEIKTLRDDVKPYVEQSAKNVAGLDSRLDDLEKRETRTEATLDGWNKLAEKRGRITPFPPQVTR